MGRVELQAVAALFSVGFICAPSTSMGQSDNSDNLGDRLKQACRATKRNCEVTALLSNGNGIYFVFNQDDFFATIILANKDQISFIHAQDHDLIKNSGEKAWRKTAPDPALRNIVWAPLTPSIDPRDDYRPPRVESLGTEQERDERLLHLRLVPAGPHESDDESLPHYWLAAVGDGKWVVRRVRTLTMLGEQVTQVDARFAKIGQAPKIELPNQR